MRVLGRAQSLIAMVVVLALLGAGAALDLGGADAAPRRGPDQTRLILRLNDLPPGYLNLDLRESQEERIFCSQLLPDSPPKLARFATRFRPKGCAGAYYRLFAVPGEPPGAKVVGTGVLALDSDRAADAAWAVVPELLAHLTRGRKPRPVAAPEQLGSATKVFHATAQPYFYPFYRKVGSSTSFLVWRSGNTLGVVMSIGQSPAETDRAAVELAQRQQTHIRHPTPYALAERFDGEVALDDPAVDLPVYWLGRNFRPGQGLPDNRLFASYFLGEPVEETFEGGFSEGPEAPLYISYRNIRLGTWTPATWNVFAKSKTARAITSWKCTRTRSVTLAEGTATIFGGYKENFRRCPKAAPEAFTAWVDIGGVKVVVNAPPAADFIETVNPYGSFAGMGAIVRALQLRPRPVY